MQKTNTRDDPRNATDEAAPATGASSPASPDEVRVRRGCTISLDPEAPWWQRNDSIHFARLRDAAGQSPQAVAVVQSAVILHGGMLKNSTEQAHIWVPWRRKTAAHDGPTLRALSKSDQRERLRRRPVVNHRMDIDLEATTVIDGILVTDLDQTAVHAARFLAPDDAVVAVDSLLAVAVGRDRYWREHRSRVEEEARRVVRRWRRSLDGLRGRRGVAQAREVFASASALSESALESEVRRIAHAAGFLKVESQVEVATALGRRWVDLGMRGVPSGIEIHGDVKFEGEDGEVRRRHEMERELELSAAGFRVFRLSGSEVFDSRLVVEVLERCFGERRERVGRRCLWTPSERRMGRADR